MIPLDQQLAAALKGDFKRGLFFTGRGALPFGAQIRSVRELLERLLGGDADTRLLASCATAVGT